MDLLMVRDRATGQFVYTEQLERQPEESSWAFVRRSVRREARIRDRFDGGMFEVLVGWGTGSVEEFLEAYPEYGPVTDGEQSGGDNVDR